MDNEFFISYSREDATLIDGSVKLLRLGRDKSVFLDRDSIEPGDRWWDEISNAIKAASTVLIFWCQHSANSEWVFKELKIAAAAKRRLIPVLLDNTTLHRLLKPHQPLDLRAVVKGSHVVRSGNPPKPHVCGSSRIGDFNEFGELTPESSEVRLLRRQLIERQVADAILKELEGIG